MKKVLLIKPKNFTNSKILERYASNMIGPDDRLYLYYPEDLSTKRLIDSRTNRPIHIDYSKAKYHNKSMAQIISSIEFADEVLLFNDCIDEELKALSEHFSGEPGCFEYRFTGKGLSAKTKTQVRLAKRYIKRLTKKMIQIFN